MAKNKLVSMLSQASKSKDKKVTRSWCWPKQWTADVDRAIAGWINRIGEEQRMEYDAYFANTKRKRGD